MMHELFGENLLSPDEGDRVRKLVHADLKSGRDVTMDFAGVRIVASSFLNSAIGQLYADIPDDVIREHLKVPNLSDAGRFALKRVVDNSKRYYSDIRYRRAVDSSASSFIEA
jgi:hypothetical protein